MGRWGGEGGEGWGGGGLWAALWGALWVALWGLCLLGWAAAEPAAARADGEAAGGKEEGAGLVLVERSVDDLMVVEVRYKGRTLTDSFTCYLGDRGQVLASLGELTRLLELPIEVEPLTGLASGWFLSEDRRFLLDIARGEVIVEGRVMALEAGQAEAHEDGVFVDVAALSQWLPLDVHVFQSQLLLRVEAREPLPMDSRLERKARWDQLKRSQEVQRGEPIALPVAWARWPGMDSATSLLARRRPDGSWVQGVDQSLLLRGDALLGSGEVFARVTGGEEALSQQLRANVEYRDDEGLIEGVKLRRVRAGSLNTMAAPLISRAEAAHGLTWGSEAGANAGEAHRVDIAGAHLPGWGVELSRDGVLLGAMMIGDDGRYLFQGVPLVFGMNRFVVTLLGPFGERVERVEAFNIGAEMRAPGQWSHDGGLFRREALPSCCAAGGEGGRWSGTLGGTYGVSDELSLAARLSLEPGRDGHHLYVLASAHAGYLEGLEQLTVIKDLQGGAAFRLSLMRHLLGQDLQLEQDALLDYASGDSPGEVGAPAHGVATRLSSSGRVWGLAYRVGYQEARLAASEEGSLQGRVAALLGDVTVAASVQAQLFPTEEVMTDLQVDARFDDFTLRGRLQAPVAPWADHVLVGSSASWRAPGGVDLRVHSQLDLGAEVRSWQVGGGGQVDLGFSHLGLQLNGGDSGASGLLTWTFSMQEDVIDGGVHVDSQPSTSQAALAARVFLDHDLDGTWSPGDEPLEGARLKVNGVSADPTDAHGVTRWRASPWRTTHVTVDRASLIDPYLAPTRERFEVTARPGTTARIDVPVVELGEVDGVVEVRMGQRSAGVGDVGLQLIGPDGHVATQTRSAHDGFFLFEGLLPGDYTLQVDPQALDTHNLTASSLPTLSLKGGDVLSGQRVELSVR